MQQTDRRTPFSLTALFTLALCALLLLPLAACGGGGDGGEAGDAATTDDPGTDAGAATSSGASDAESPSVGYAVENEGTIAPGAAGRDFTAGDVVWVSVATEGAEAGAAVEVVWYGPEGLEAAAVDGSVETGTAHQALSTDTTGWPAGTYRAEVWVGNELVEELSIEVGAGTA